MLLESRNSAAIFCRLSAVTVSAHGFPTHLSLNVAASSSLPNDDVANHALPGVGHDQCDVRRQR